METYFRVRCTGKLLIIHAYLIQVRLLGLNILFGFFVIYSTVVILF